MGEIISAALPALFEGGADFFAGGGGEALGAGSEALLSGGGEAALGAGEGLGSSVFGAGTDAQFFMGGAEGLGEAATSLTVPVGMDVAAGGAGGLFEGLGGGISSLFSGLGSGVENFFGSGAGMPDTGGITSGINALSTMFNPVSTAAAATPPVAGAGVGADVGQAGFGSGTATGGTGAPGEGTGLFNTAPSEALSGTALGPPQTFAMAGSGGQGAPATDSGTGADTGDAEAKAKKAAALKAAEQPGGGQSPSIDETALSTKPPQAPLNLNPPNQTPQGGLDAAKAASTTTPKSGNSIWDTLGNAAKIVSPAVAAAGLGYNIYQQNQNKLPTTNQLGTQALQDAKNTQAAVSGQAQATSTAAQQEGLQLASYIANNQLPPAMEESVNQATQGAIATAKSRMAAQGLSADPTKNSMLADQIEQINRNAQVQRATLMQQLAQTGGQLIQTGLNASQTSINAANLTQRVYDNLIRVNEQQSANTGAAIARLAGSLNSKPVNITMG